MINKTPIHIANRPKAYEIKIGEKVINNEYEFVSLDLNYSVDSPVITGVLIINDVLDLNRTTELKNTIVSFKLMDIFDGFISKEFVIIKVIETEHTRNEKALTIMLQDTFSYTLSKSYMSKSYNGNPTKAITDYIEILGLDSYETDISVLDEDFDFCIPSHIDNLSAFQHEFNNIGYVFYQTRDKIVVKHYSEVLPSELEFNGLYSDKAEQHNQNLIHDFRIERNDRRMLKPKVKAYAFNIETKQMEYFDDNSIDDLLLNDDDVNIQDELEMKHVYQTHLNFDEYKKCIKNSLLNRNTVHIVVSGYKKNDLYQIYEIRLSGIKTSKETLISGNAVVSGKYVSASISDKLYAGSLLQSIKLIRADERKAKS